MPSPTQTRGQQAEDRACEHLQENGLRILQRNYRLRSGEIDIIGCDTTHIVFIEVRLRYNPNFGGALASVDWRKQQRIIRTAQHYLMCHATDLPARFDVIAISKDGTLQWLQNAFDAD